ncbi:putative phosphatidylinositol glycan class V, related protein [Toxoplasma gondii RUB]|uniref:Putative phosphatidylinositol glycan class V, related protein n=1 Tax=Toxoplasma gondii RUB TaxID=935652 RepID=A0A086LY74_TOXGO|nr:putative phosphatidylinositol glycan class V, related protein [Toxoplasma gondii RUB]
MPTSAQVGKPLKARTSLLRLRLRVLFLAFLSRLLCLSLTCLWAHLHPTYNSQSSLLHPTAPKRQDYISPSLLARRLSAPHSAALRHFHPFHLTVESAPLSLSQEQRNDRKQRAGLEEGRTRQDAPPAEQARVLVLTSVTDEGIAQLFPRRGVGSGVRTPQTQARLPSPEDAPAFLAADVAPVSALPPWGRDSRLSSSLYRGETQWETTKKQSLNSGGRRVSSGGSPASRVSSSGSSPGFQTDQRVFGNSPINEVKLDGVLWRLVVPFLSWDGEYFLTFALQKTAYYFELTHAFFPGLSVVYIHLGGFLRRLLSRAAEVADSAVPRSSSRFSASESEESEESRSSKGFQSSPPLQDSFPFPARIDDAVVYGFAAVLVSNLAFVLAALGVFEVARMHLAAEARVRGEADEQSRDSRDSACPLFPGENCSPAAAVYTAHTDRDTEGRKSVHSSSDGTQRHSYLQASWKREGEDVHVIEGERNRQMPSVERARDENEESCRIAFLAAGWFSFSAANIHMSAAYTESLFAALTMWGLYMLLFAEHPPAGSPQSFDCLDTPEEAPQDGKDMPKAVRSKRECNAESRLNCTSVKQSRHEASSRSKEVEKASPRPCQSTCATSAVRAMGKRIRKRFLTLLLPFLLRLGATFLFFLASFLRSNGSLALAPLFFHTLRTCPLVGSLRPRGRQPRPPNASSAMVGNSPHDRKTHGSREGDKSEAAALSRRLGNSDESVEGRGRKDEATDGSVTHTAVQTQTWLCHVRGRRSYGRLLVATGYHWIFALFQAVAVVLPIFLAMAYPWYLYCACPKTSQVVTSTCHVASAFLGQTVPTPYSQDAEADSLDVLPSFVPGAEPSAGFVSSSLKESDAMPAPRQDSGYSTVSHSFGPAPLRRHTLTFSQFAYRVLAVGLPQSAASVFSRLRRFLFGSRAYWASEAEQVATEAALDSAVSLGVHAVGRNPVTGPAVETPERGCVSGPSEFGLQSGPGSLRVFLGNKERVISNAASPMPPWCSARVPNIYPWIQREYWDVYFLGFFRFKNLYLIILALPFYFLAMSCILFFLRRTWGLGRCAETLSDDAVNQGREATGELLEGEKPRHSLRGMQGSKNFNLRWSKNVTSLWRQGGRFFLSVVLDPAFGEICQLAFLMMFMFLCGNTNVFVRLSTASPILFLNMARLHDAYSWRKKHFLAKSVSSSCVSPSCCLSGRASSMTTVSRDQHQRGFRMHTKNASEHSSAADRKPDGAVSRADATGSGSCDEDIVRSGNNANCAKVPPPVGWRWWGFCSSIILLCHFLGPLFFGCYVTWT